MSHPAIGECVAMPPSPADAAVAASFEQQRLWLLDRSLPKGALNTGALATLAGAVDPDVLRRGLREVADRHASLRGCVRMQDGAVVFEVAPAVTFDLPVIDLRRASPSARAARLRELVDTEFDRPFDLEAPPLVRFMLVLLDAERSALNICAHHAVCDHRSLRILIAELGALRAGTANASRVPPPGPLGLDHRQFIAWQHREYEQGAWAESLHYWREQLAGFAPSRPVRGLAHGPAQGTERSAPIVHRRDRQVLDKPLVERLRACANEHAATPFMVMLACVVAWLHARTGDEDLVLACPVSGRWLRGAGNTVGLFAYPIPLRVRLTPGTSFHELVRRVRATAIGTYRHQHVPFSKIEHAAAAGGAVPRGLANVLCNLICISAETVGLGAAEVDWHQSTSGIPLSVTWIDDDETLSVEVAGVAESIESTSGHARSTLAGYAARCLRNPEKTMNEIAATQPRIPAGAA
jgi:hypothetical protein